MAVYVVFVELKIGLEIVRRYCYRVFGLLPAQVPLQVITPKGFISTRGYNILVIGVNQYGSNKEQVDEVV